ncbi:MAG TPA: relaxase/mobilization nuclease domain-containing protein [Puia sp.]|jgi:hypothetical protein|nr:relaxase/mobilization nuclease domain-containing protein [Puia sp.]
MRPKITSCHHISHSIIYNEQKIEVNKAERLAAANMLKPLDRLSQDDIIHRFERRMELNDRVRTSLHITLNFDPQDELANDRMQEIARTYMKDIGFERQPWIAWRHNDAGHPHCHIVTTHVQWNGDPIDLYKIGERQSEQARLKIEKEFHLVTAEMKMEQRRQRQRLNDRQGPPRLIYGEQPLARALSDIVGYVTERYCYTSLRELNAVLRLYNVQAYTGQPGTKLHRDHGLLYRALDDNGRYIGRPLKASFFDSKPTLENLEMKFRQNHSLKQAQKESVEGRACWHLYGEPDNFEKVREDLCRDGVELVLSRDRSGTVQHVAYVDVGNKVIITDEDHDRVWACDPTAIQTIIERDKIRQAYELTLTETERQDLRQGPRLRL